MVFPWGPNACKACYPLLKITSGFEWVGQCITKITLTINIVNRSERLTKRLNNFKSDLKRTLIKSRFFMVTDLGVNDDMSKCWRRRLKPITECRVAIWEKSASTHTSQRIKAEIPFALQGGRKSRTEITHGGYNYITDNNNTTIYTVLKLISFTNPFLHSHSYSFRAASACTELKGHWLCFSFWQRVLD